MRLILDNDTFPASPYHFFSLGLGTAGIALDEMRVDQVVPDVQVDALEMADQELGGVIAELFGVDLDRGESGADELSDEGVVESDDGHVVLVMDFAQGLFHADGECVIGGNDGIGQAGLENFPGGFGRQGFDEPGAMDQVGIDRDVVVAQRIEITLLAVQRDAEFISARQKGDVAAALLDQTAGHLVNDGLVVIVDPEGILVVVGMADDHMGMVLGDQESESGVVLDDGCQNDAVCPAAADEVANQGFSIVIFRIR